MSCELQKTGRKRKVKPVVELKPKCFAFRGGKSCKRTASIETGLCGCKPCIITPAQQHGFDRYVKLLNTIDGGDLANDWKKSMHERFLADFIAVNTTMMNENKLLIADMTSSASSGASTSLTPVKPTWIPNLNFDATSSSGEDVEDDDDDVEVKGVCNIIAKLNLK
jgi:hypothetical protein